MFLLWNFIRTGINTLNFTVINHLKNYKLYKIKLYIFENSYKILEEYINNLIFYISETKVKYIIC